MSALEKIIALNHINHDRYRPLYFNDQKVGAIRIDRINTIKKFPHLFTQTHQCSSLSPLSLSFCEQFVESSFETRNIILAEFCDYLKANAIIKEWRNELYPVFKQVDSRREPLFVIERGCIGFLGLPAYGVHINGFVRINDERQMWVAKRSVSRPVAPGKLDQITAGGLPFGLEPLENVIKECEEEASIPKNLSIQANFIHTIRYHAEDERGVKPDYLYVYDLELPIDFIPQSNDGEAELFSLFSLDHVADLVINSDSFKPNSGLVVIDFLIRHDYLPSVPELSKLIL